MAVSQPQHTLLLFVHTRAREHPDADYVDVTSVLSTLGVSVNDALALVQDLRADGFLESGTDLTHLRLTDAGRAHLDTPDPPDEE